ncbi:hypothetical protein B0H10DRAFT_2204133 [Mycena sp. CBHHK59/15]|nr:hypothetical protein B0H10DRAFT_2204133 [Mycena sp. CBHHK59/15]
MQSTAPLSSLSILGLHSIPMLLVGSLSTYLDSPVAALEVVCYIWVTHKTVCTSLISISSLNLPYAYGEGILWKPGQDFESHVVVTERPGDLLNPKSQNNAAKFDEKTASENTTLPGTCCAGCEEGLGVYFRVERLRYKGYHCWFYLVNQAELPIWGDRALAASRQALLRECNPSCFRSTTILRGQYPPKHQIDVVAIDVKQVETESQARVNWLKERHSYVTCNGRPALPLALTYQYTLAGIPATSATGFNLSRASGGVWFEHA